MLRGRPPQFGSAHPTRPNFRSGREDLPANPNARPQWQNAHRSNAQELMAKVPVVKVAGTVAMCDGGA